MEQNFTNDYDKIFTKSELLTFKKLHKISIKGIYTILKSRQIFKKITFIFSLLFSIITIIFVFYFQIERSYVLLDNTTGMVLEIFPNLLGFSFGAYSLIVGFSNIDFLRRGTKMKRNSLYQFLTATFAFALLIQIVSLFLSFIIQWIIRNNVSILLPEFYANLLNQIFLFLVLFFTIYAILLIPFVITNLFTLSQVNHLYLTIENYRSARKSQFYSNLPNTKSEQSANK
jgi:magnesium-transporting ATPase (P-type)